MPGPRNRPAGIIALLKCFLFFTNQEFIELLAERMGALQASGTQQIVQYLAQTSPTYLPIALYEPTDSLKTPFNYDLMAS